MSGQFKPAEGAIRGDLAESWEVSPDGLTITMKLRQGVKWHNKAPVNGRAVDADDVLVQLEPLRLDERNRRAAWSTASTRRRRCCR